MIPASQLRIAILSAHSCPIGNLGTKDTGGMSVYIRELAYELGQQGHSVDVYTCVHDAQDPQIVSLGQNTRLIHLKAGENEEVDKLAMYSYLPDFACNLEKFREYNNIQYDLVFSNYWLSTWVGEYLQRWWHVPHITMFHTLGVVKNTMGIGEDEPELRIETEGELARNCHYIIAPTVKEKEALIHHYGASPENIKVIPCGVNLKLFRPVDKEIAKQQLGFAGQKILLFVGRIEPLKGIDQLIKSISCLPNTQGLRLIIIGGDQNSQYEMERLRELSRSLNLETPVDFLGSIEHEQMPCFYGAADVCVVPSYYESFGLVAVESLACGTPVVATNVGDLTSIIRQGKTGYVVADNTPHHLADGIALLLSRLTNDRKSILLTRASVRRFDWPNIAQTIIEEFQLVLDNYCVPVS
ncbi:glycosyltransferase [Chloroflexota bacterium]